jgi:hypothetical protein
MTIWAMWPCCAGFCGFWAPRMMLPAPPHRLLPQNPEPLAEKVTNPREMAAVLGAA